MISSIYGWGQTQYTYPLISHFSALQPTAPDLIQIPNNSGLYGEFVLRPVPITTCGDGGEAYGYYFEDDAGLQFNNPQGFIDQAYSLAFNFQMDEFISPPPWVRLVSFTHTDDVGLYIALTDPPAHGTLEFWPYGYAGEGDFFSTVDFYQMILVRNDDGLIKVYVNGQEFAEYDDSGTQKFVPGDPENYIVFFRDHPSVLSNESSPGFVSDIIIGNRAWSETEVLEVWDEFCGSLFDIVDVKELTFSMYPNPAKDLIHISLETSPFGTEIQIINLLGKMVETFYTKENTMEVNISGLKNGIYFIKVIQNGQIAVRKMTKK